MHSRISKGRPVVSKVLIHSKGRKRRWWAFLYRYICRSAQIPVCCLPFVQLHSYSLLPMQMSWWNGMLYKNKYRQFEKNTETQNHNTCQSPDLHIQFCRTSVFKKSVVNTGIKIYNKLPCQMRKLKKMQHIMRELRSFSLQHTFYSIDKNVSLISRILIDNLFALWEDNLFSH